MCPKVDASSLKNVAQGIRLWSSIFTAAFEPKLRRRERQREALKIEIAGLALRQA